MDSSRKIQTVIDPQPVVEGAGVRLKRSIATRTLNYLDPFLLLDHFASDNPLDYEAGFPLHPHRGIETVTYMLSGAVNHRDTLGNAGSIGPGQVQWMTSGRGILHEEMPQVRPEGIAGFQIWVNLPAKLKMTKPRYQDIQADRIPVVERADGSRIRVVSGMIDGVEGSVTEIYANPTYLDVFVPPHTQTTLPVSRGDNAFAYVFEGRARFGEDGVDISAPKLLIWQDGDSVSVRTSESPVRFLLISGKPLNEPVARYGPFVMNTKEEIQQTLDDLRRGTFIQEDAS